MKHLNWYGWYDNVLLGQGHHLLREGMTDENGSIVE
jgi:hypothetical protein